MGAIDISDIPRYSYDDYIKWEDNWELIYGYPYAMSPAPMIKHQKISTKIARWLDEALEGCNICQTLLPIDWKISSDTIVQPDISVICHTPTKESYISIAPKIIFEILSKSTEKRDRGIKYNLYEKEGVEYYIIVDPENDIAKVYKLNSGRYTKVCDTKDDIVEFEIKECNKKIEFDMGKIW
jgi:Uma2 family endonuclease